MLIRRPPRFGGINVTGKLDKETVELMGTPRCGVQDVLEEQLADEQEILDIGDKEEQVFVKVNQNNYKY